jgi:hypothetical protein
MLFLGLHEAQVPVVLVWRDCRVYIGFDDEEVVLGLSFFYDKDRGIFDPL